MSYVGLDSVAYSNCSIGSDGLPRHHDDDEAEALGMRCKTPTPPTSADASREQSAFSVPRHGASNRQQHHHTTPPPVLPTHTGLPTSSDRLPSPGGPRPRSRNQQSESAGGAAKQQQQQRTAALAALDDSLSELQQALPNAHVPSTVIDTLCEKIDILSEVVYRHERALKGDSSSLLFQQQQHRASSSIPQLNESATPTPGQSMVRDGTGSLTSGESPQRQSRLFVGNNTHSVSSSPPQPLRAVSAIDDGSRQQSDLVNTILSKVEAVQHMVNSGFMNRQHHHQHHRQDQRSASLQRTPGGKSSASSNGDSSSSTEALRQVTTALGAISQQLGRQSEMLEYVLRGQIALQEESSAILRRQSEADLADALGHEEEEEAANTMMGAEDDDDDDDAALRALREQQRVAEDLALRRQLRREAEEEEAELQRQRDYRNRSATSFQQQQQQHSSIHSSGGGLRLRQPSFLLNPSSADGSRDDDQLFPARHRDVSTPVPNEEEGGSSAMRRRMRSLQQSGGGGSVRSHISADEASPARGGRSCGTQQQPPSRPTASSTPPFFNDANNTSYSSSAKSHISVNEVSPARNRSQVSVEHDRIHQTVPRSVDSSCVQDVGTEPPRYVNQPAFLIRSALKKEGLSAKKSGLPTGRVLFGDAAHTDSGAGIIGSARKKGSSSVPSRRNLMCQPNVSSHRLDDSTASTADSYSSDGGDMRLNSAENDILRRGMDTPLLARRLAEENTSLKMQLDEQLRKNEELRACMEGSPSPKRAGYVF